MKRNWLGYLVVSIALAGGVAYYMNQPKRGPVPDSVFDAMAFPDDAVMETLKGDADGVMCQQLNLRTADGTTMVSSHKLWHYDFRKMTVAEKKAALIAGAKAAARESELAYCNEPDDSVFLQSAYAQPHCDQCSGGCDVRSCPATVVMGGGCVLGGTNCVITYLCCSGSCNC